MMQNNDITGYLPEVIHSLNVDQVYVALDMDKLYNPEVKKALIVLRNVLTGIDVGQRDAREIQSIKA